MYAGPAGHVNPEEYLTGRAVDKTFEQFKLGGADPIGLGIPFFNPQPFNYLLI